MAIGIIREESIHYLKEEDDGIYIETHNSDTFGLSLSLDLHMRTF